MLNRPQMETAIRQRAICIQDIEIIEKTGDPYLDFWHNRVARFSPEFKMNPGTYFIACETETPGKAKFHGRVIAVSDDVEFIKGIVDKFPGKGLEVFSIEPKNGCHMPSDCSPIGYPTPQAV